MDEVYRGYRIAIRQADRWIARVTHARGTLLALDASSSLGEGPAICLARARTLIDSYVAFLGENGIGGEPN